MLVELAEGARPIAELERETLRMLDSRSRAELNAIAAFLRDMNAIGGEHVARLQT